jgi:DNA polymerase-1
MTARDPLPFGPDSHLYLIDGSGYIFRAYHALPPLSRASDGLPVGAVSGFCNMLWKLLRDARDGVRAGERPTHLAVIFDAGAHTFRNDLYSGYKAQRPPPPEDLVPQFPLTREAAEAFGAPALELSGYEADDLIATYARAAEAHGGRVTIISSDKDLMQLVTDRVNLYDGMKNLRLGRDAVIEKFGVPPEKVIEVQALAGDSVDNVPGAPGIGIKTAAQLITEYGDVETLLARAQEIKQPKRRETLIEHADAIRLSRTLVTLKHDVPGLRPLDSLAVTEPEADSLLAFLDRLELRQLGTRVRESFGATGTAFHTRAPSAPSGAASPPQRPGAPPSEPPLTGVPWQAPHPPLDRAGYVAVTDAATLDAWIAEAYTAGVVAVDTETMGLDITTDRLVGVSLAVAPGRACYIPLTHTAPGESAAADLFAPAAEPGLLAGQIPLADAIARLKPLLEDPGVLKVGQNIKFDLSILARQGITVSPVDDTMLVSYVLAAGLQGHGMDELSIGHLGHTPIPFKEVAGIGKAQVTFDRVPLDRATAYAAEDADVTLRLWHILKPRLVSEYLTTVYETLERPLIPVVAAMEQAGVKVDRDRLSRLSGEFAQRMAALEDEAQAIAGRPFNLGSPKQIGDILFGEMGLKGGKKTATGAWSTDVEVLEDLAAEGQPLARVLLDWRQLSKLKGTYTDALRDAISPATGRVHTSFSLAAAATGRLASSDPNLQNIPVRNEEGRKIREAFIAEPGNVLISADYSQIELRLLAHIAGIDALKDAFRRGLDIHAMTASEMFGVPIEGMPSEVRRRAKAINFGIIYGISGFGLARQLSIPQSEASAYIKQYFERFPGIRDYMEATKAFAREAGYVTTAFGRRVWLREIKSKTPASRAFAERQAINAPIQGSAADIIKRAMVRLPGALAEAGLNARMLLQVHDELVFEAPRPEAEATRMLVKRVMEQACAPALTLSVPLVVDAKAGATWNEVH